MTAATAAPSPAPAARSPYFISMPADVLLIGGLSIVHFIIFAQSWQALVAKPLSFLFGPLLQAVVTPFYHLCTALYKAVGLPYGYPADFVPDIYDAAMVAAVLTWVINHPHFSATSHRLYRSRASIMQFPVTALGVPIVLLALLLAAMSQPETIGAWFVKIFLIWSPYHFSAQTVGITHLYARRIGFNITPMLRKCLNIFVFGTYLGPTLAAEAYPNLTYFTLKIPTFGLPPGLFPLYKALIITAGIITLVLLLIEAWKQNKRVPLILMLVPFTQYVWFIAGAGVAGFQEFVPGYHSLQYLLIAWAINLKEREDEGRVKPTPWHASLESLRWFALNIAGGAFLFFLLPLAGGMVFPVDPYVAGGIVVAAVQIHHFFVDGVIWKLRNPRVGQPLMTSWPELTGRTAPT